MDETKEGALGTLTWSLTEAGKIADSDQRCRIDTQRGNDKQCLSKLQKVNHMIYIPGTSQSTNFQTNIINYYVCVKQLDVFDC